MINEIERYGLIELVNARKQSRRIYWFVGIFSVFANFLMLTGPLYMLQVYDRVLGSRSEATLIALSLLVVFLYGIMGILDYARGRAMARAGARFQSALDHRVFDASMRAKSQGSQTARQSGLNDLEAIQRLMSSPVLLAIFDAPWTPVFLVGITLFHPWLGALAIAGGGTLILITVLNQVLSKSPQEKAFKASAHSQVLSDQIRNESETIDSMGMRESAFSRWIKAREASLVHAMSANDVSGTFVTLSKTFRLLLQSAMLGLGAYLVLQDQLTAGAMIAASILLGRALAPIELAIRQWQMVQRARIGWKSLAGLLAEVPPEAPRTDLMKPKAKLGVENLTLVPFGQNHPVLRNVSFAVEPGTAVGVIGSSGAGKSSLARALTGAWKPAAGCVRLDGAELEHYGSEALGRYVGYLPQVVRLFDGTIAENIARLDPQAQSDKIIEAAKKAGAHDIIQRFPDGYDTQISANAVGLSGGQVQRIGLARALYNDPVIVILDEPNSNLDNEGSLALNAAIRSIKEAGSSVLIMAHRPSALQECDQLLVLNNGTVAAFGPRDEVLNNTVKNAAHLRNVSTMGGVR